MVGSDQTKKTVTLPYLYVIDQQHDILGQVKVAQVEHNGITNYRLPQDTVDLSKQTREETRTQHFSAQREMGDIVVYSV